MRNKDIKEKLKKSALDEMPDVFSKINIEEIVIEPKTQSISKAKIHINLKLAFSAFLIVISSFFVYQLINLPEGEQPILSDIQALSFQTVSAGALAEYGIEEVQTLSASTLMMHDQASDMEPYLEEMTPMIHLAEMMVNQKDQIDYQILDSSDPDYQYQVRFSALTLNQQMLQYDIYYNQDKTGISGRVVYGQRSYLFSKDEQFYQLYINSSEYIEVINSKEDTPSQFTFKYMKNQSEMFSTNIILSENSGEYQADFIYQNNQGLLMRMAMSRQQADAIEVDYEVNDNAITFTGMYRVKVENEQITGKPFYRFTFNDESETAKQRPGNMPNDTPGHGPDKDDPPGHGPNNDDSPGKDDTPGNRPF